ncbi:PREDICTED: uncharacterized protein LOC109208619 [Nicotiana attenuata]|uniref:uncharacterized protein LOC109208619 n=1 Tax=Nicotiana attenuata TaxID=49451 RepID=UPI000904EE95|nr:PREDICTED: uncharacterized protein LOC109208619 [Nicotiana attenuata]
MDEPSSPLNQTMHRDITERLLYLTASRPDIMLRVAFCARFKSNSKDSHLKAGVRILRYLRGTRNLVLYYPSSSRKKNSMALQQLKQNMYHQPPVVLKCCGPSSKLEELESNSSGPNTLIVEDQVADIFTKSPGKKAF